MLPGSSCSSGQAETDCSDTDAQHTETTQETGSAPATDPDGALWHTTAEFDDLDSFADIPAEDTAPTDDDDDDDDFEEAAWNEDAPDVESITQPQNLNRSSQSTSSKGRSWEDRKPPTIDEAEAARDDLKKQLNPSRGENSKGYKDPKIGRWTYDHRKDILTMLNHYVLPTSPHFNQWTAAADTTARGVEKGEWFSRRLRACARAYIADREDLVGNPFGAWCASLIENLELKEDLAAHLATHGKYVRAMDIVDYLQDPDRQQYYGMKKAPSLATAKRWMRELDYRWSRHHKGIYIDGHEREDVVYYRQNIFLPQWYEIEPRMRRWLSKEGLEEVLYGPWPEDFVPPQPITVWFHDESIFYQNDRRQSQWVKKGSSPVPLPKGEGASCMVADLVSADYGWLRSKDGSDSAREFLKPGKNREGYYDNDDILRQASHAMDILDRDYPDEAHVFVYDNAKTHLKRPEGSLSARKMPKFTPKLGTNWGVEITAKDCNGNVIYATNGKPAKTKIRMHDGQFADGSAQSLYFPHGHPREGVFKGMAEILTERGFENAYRLPAECHGFKCKDGAISCCCRRLLYTQPDFVHVKSSLELLCEARGYRVIFLPKFHPELNFIEQCWGTAKREYRKLPRSTSEAETEPNVVKSLATVTLHEMRKYVDYSTEKTL